LNPVVRRGNYGLCGDKVRLKFPTNRLNPVVGRRLTLAQAETVSTLFPTNRLNPVVGRKASKDGCLFEEILSFQQIDLTQSSGVLSI
ncbi:MAG: hypothetical protein WBV73_23685, partial [Phormidium sp.]